MRGLSLQAVITTNYLRFVVYLTKFRLGNF